MTIASRLGRIIGLLALASALTACSAIKLGYNNIDGLAYWWLDSYLDFTDEQEGRVREDLDRLHAWHRASELPQFIALLQAMEQAAPADVTAAQACSFITQAQQRLEALSERAEPAVVTLVLGLTPEQLAHLERKYEKGNEEFRKDWIRPPASEIAEKRLDKFIERSEMIYGKLDAAQRAVLRRQLQQSSFDGKRVLAERQRRQRDTLQTLRKVAGQPIPLAEARSLMRAYLDRQKQPADPADRAFQQSLIDEACANAAALHNSTTAAQREAGARRLRAYQRDLRELSAQK
jgi:Tat protein secretion system quality control protein TatD with DNase activity